MNIKERGFSSIVLLTLLVGIFIVGGGWYRLSKKSSSIDIPPISAVQTQTQTVSSTPIAEPSPTVASPKIKDEMENWKTYVSKTWGFSLKYPANYIPGVYENTWLEDSGEDVFALVDPSHQGRYGFSVHVSQQQTVPDETVYNTTEELFEALQKKGGNAKKINLNGIEAMERIDPPLKPDGHMNMTVNLVKSQLIYTISIFPADRADFNTILSTFKFISPTDIQTKTI